MPIFSKDAPLLLENHLQHLREGSGISVEVIKERGYRSILNKGDLEKFGFLSSQRRAPGILIPLWGVDGGQVGCQYRPDNPRSDSRGRPVKYESPVGSSNHLDCPPRCRQMLGDPKTPLWITEGSKKADALASHGACVISLTGVWGFKGKNEFGAITLLSDWDRIAIKDRLVYLAFDSDVVSKELVRKALEHLGEHLSRKGAGILVVYLPQEGNQKVGIDDYLLSHSLEEARKLATDFRVEDIESRERFVPGFVLHDGTIGEMVVSKEDERAFIIVVNGSVRKVFRYETPKAIYLPLTIPW